MTNVLMPLLALFLLSNLACSPTKSASTSPQKTEKKPASSDSQKEEEEDQSSDEGKDDSDDQEESADPVDKTPEQGAEEITHIKLKSSLGTIAQTYDIDLIKKTLHYAAPGAIGDNTNLLLGDEHLEKLKELLKAMSSVDPSKVNFACSKLSFAMEIARAADTELAFGDCQPSQVVGKDLKFFDNASFSELSKFLENLFGDPKVKKL